MNYIFVIRIILEDLVCKYIFTISLRLINNYKNTFTTKQNYYMKYLIIFIHSHCGKYIRCA